MPVTIGIQTNGTLIDQSLINIFKKYQIQVGISVDGPPDIQESLRGKARYTFKSLSLLNSNLYPFRITTVVTKENINYLDRLAMIIGSFESAKGMGLDLLVNKGRVLKGNRSLFPTREDILLGIKNLLTTLKLVNSIRKYPLQLREINNLIKRGNLNNNHRIFCHALKGEAMAVCPDGRVYPCSQTANDPFFESGNIIDPGALDLGRLKPYVLRTESCNNCELNCFCPGDCPSRVYYNAKDQKELICTMYRAMWKELGGRLI